MMNRNRNNFSVFHYLMTALVLGLMVSGCSRQVAMNGKVNQIRYVQTQDIPASYAANKTAGNDLSVVAPKPEGQLAPTAPLAAKPDITTKSVTKHGFAQKSSTKTING